MKVLLAAVTCEKGGIEHNLAHHCAVLDDAARRGCDLAVFPEFSLTGSVDPTQHPEHAVAADDAHVRRLAQATGDTGVGALFGFAERRNDDFYIAQAYADGGHVVGIQRKRKLGDDEVGFETASDTEVFTRGQVTFGAVICAEAHADFVWDATAAARVDVAFVCSAPGLYERRTTEQEWRNGFDWWHDRGLGDARRHARRLGLWVAMATQAGSTVDEDFPGLAALIDPGGEVVAQLPDWRPGTMVVAIPPT